MLGQLHAILLDGGLKNASSLHDADIVYTRRVDPHVAGQFVRVGQKEIVVTCEQSQEK